jgi:hypothetical protein
MITTADVKKWEDWYNMSTSQIRKLGGSGMLDYYGNSLFKSKNVYTINVDVVVCKEMFPRHDWDPLKFKQLPHSHWKDMQMHRRFFEDLKTKLSIFTRVVNNTHMMCNHTTTSSTY